MNWGLWKKVSDEKIARRMKYDAKCMRFTKANTSEQLLKHILLQIRLAEDQAAYIMIHDAERELKEFTLKLIRGEFS